MTSSQGIKPINRRVKLNPVRRDKKRSRNKKLAISGSIAGFKFHTNIKLPKNKSLSDGHGIQHSTFYPETELPFGIT